jgi:hypothetical protein
MERQKFFLSVSVCDEHGNVLVCSEPQPLLLAREVAELHVYPGMVGNYYANLLRFCANASHYTQALDALTVFSRSNYVHPRSRTKYWTDPGLRAAAVLMEEAEKETK